MALLTLLLTLDLGSCHPSFFLHFPISSSSSPHPFYSYLFLFMFVLFLFFCFIFFSYISYMCFPFSLPVLYVIMASLYGAILPQSSTEQLDVFPPFHLPHTLSTYWLASRHLRTNHCPQYSPYKLCTKIFPAFLLDCLTLDDEIERLSRNTE